MNAQNKTLKFLLGAFFAVLFNSENAFAATRTVSTPSQLQSALKSANSGDTIVLNAGNYGNVTINSVRKTLTISSNRKAKISVLVVDNSSKLTFDGLYIDGKADILNSSQLTFKNLFVDGTTDASGYAVGTGFSVASSSDIVVKDSEFQRYLRGVAFRHVIGLKVLNNIVHDMSGDGMVFAGVVNTLIEGNTIRDMRGNPNSTYHDDLIQFWTTSTKYPSQNVIIRNNILNANHLMSSIQRNEPATAHCILIHNELAEAGNKSFFYKNFLIENNDITCAHKHGLMVSYADGLTIKGNSVLQDSRINSSKQILLPEINAVRGSKAVRITNNKIHGINYNKNGTESGPVPASWVVKDNKIVKP